MLLKRFFSVFITGCLLVSGLQTAAAAQTPNVTVKINGAVQSFDAPPVLKNGRVLVPFRKIFEVMGAKVEWDPKARTVIANNFDTQIVLRIGDRTAYVNTFNGTKYFENQVELDVPPEISNGRTLVPLRFVSENFDAKVEWVASNRTVLITTVPSAAFLPDKNLEQAIRNALGKRDGSLKKEDLKSLKILNIMSDTIDLTGLENATNLKELFLNVNHLTHPEVLGSLSSLQNLSLDHVQTKDVSFLAGLTQLQKLRIADVPVESIAPLEKLTELKDLQISTAPIKDIRALAGLSQLETLDLERNQITDISPLKGLSKLSNLTIYDNPVKDVTALQGLTSLTNLSLPSTKVTDGTPLGQLKNLQELSLPFCSLTNIDFAANLTQLQLLNVTANKIQSIDPLAKLDQLKIVYFGENPIQDISPLAGHKALERLSFNNSKVSDISILPTLPALKELVMMEIAIDWKTNAAALAIRQQLEKKGVDVRY